MNQPALFCCMGWVNYVLGTLDGQGHLHTGYTIDWLGQQNTGYTIDGLGQPHIGYTIDWLGQLHTGYTRWGGSTIYWVH